MNGVTQVFESLGGTVLAIWTKPRVMKGKGKEEEVNEDKANTQLHHMRRKLELLSSIFGPMRCSAW